ncbi:histidinol-phosphate transaminase [Oceanospirillum linum]|uniref:Histidinol-phosphate aminotransferase n=1 Tax=Oceanospirillum linum TaxID=966 RepID=A0A1T1HAL4_OCELI|nr:histidinol-phosphate transaminase [Oceanospirillum linum]OOV86816.1 histidinol-phosphate transaminase [Oceanospirillum linum]SEG21680.1 histidinol-phosphate aminotransferase [Oleiphilus messinensis]SMP25129.1 histidinol-phosphate aminotransferase [Oceanospirillum linum]
MSKFWSDALNSLQPYVPGEQPKTSNIIKLNTNENPYPPSPKVIEALDHFPMEKLRLYPDPDGSVLKEALSHYFELPMDHVFVGNGSDEVLAHAFMAFFRQKKPLLMPAMTYSFYDVYCNLYNIEAEHIPLTDDFCIDLSQYHQDNGGIIFANPNAPTGIAVSLGEIEELLQRNTNTLVLVDEAYVDFGAESACSLIGKYSNLLVVQTLSKSRSLAGMRIGFALGHPDLIAGLERVKNSFNSYPLDMLALASATAAIEDTSYFAQTVQQIISDRNWTTEQLKSLGFEVLPSSTNFVFARHRTAAGDDLMTYLRHENILVRHFTKPGIENYLRISIGTREEMQTLITALEGYAHI